MLSLPKEIIVIILNNLHKEWLHGEDCLSEGEEGYEHCKKLTTEFCAKPDSCCCGYYEGIALYQTCKDFQWLTSLELIHISSGEFRHNIVISNINGSISGVLNKGRGGLVGYNLNGQQNEYYTDSHYFYREIDGVVYVDKGKIWKTNSQIIKIKNQIFKVDKDLKMFFNTEETDVFCEHDRMILLREPNHQLKKLKFKYKIKSNLKTKSEYFK